MKKVLISLLLGVSMVTMVGCGNNSKEVANANVEQNEREGAYPNFQDKETDEPIGLSKEEKEEMAIENANNQFADVNAKYNSEQSDVEAITLCYIDNGIIHIYDFMDYTNSTKCTNEQMAISISVSLDEELLTNLLETGEIIIDNVKASFMINGLKINDYEIVYHECIGNPSNETFYEIFVTDGDGNITKLFGEKVN